MVQKHREKATRSWQRHTHQWGGGDEWEKFCRSPVGPPMRDVYIHLDWGRGWIGVHNIMPNLYGKFVTTLKTRCKSITFFNAM